MVRQCYPDDGIQTDPNCPQGGENHLTISVGGGALDNVVDPVIRGQSRPLAPMLQLEDGSYVGTVFSSSGTYMVNFDTLGGVQWMVPGYTPRMATADGGIIATDSGAFDFVTGTFLQSAATTFDSTGTPTSQLPTFPMYSWKAAYQSGLLASVLVPAPTLAASFGSILNGNFSGNGTPGIQPYIDVIWCGTGYGEMGSCSSVGGVDVPWKYIPHVTDTNFVGAVDFSTAHPEWVDSLQSATMNTLQKAVSQFPVIVERPAPHNTPWWQCIKNLEFPGCAANHVQKLYMSGVFPGDASTGETTGLVPLTFVYYWKALENAQIALDKNPVYPPQTNNDTVDFVRLFQAVGAGLGNSAAHELGHQFAYKVQLTMDCNEPNAGRPCANGDANVFELYAASNWFYTHVFPEIHWQNQNNGSVCAISQFFNKRYRDTACTVDLTK